MIYLDATERLEAYLEQASQCRSEVLAGLTYDRPSHYTTLDDYTILHHIEIQRYYCCSLEHSLLQSFRLSRYCIVLASLFPLDFPRFAFLVDHSHPWTLAVTHPSAPCRCLVPPYRSFPVVRIALIGSYLSFSWR